MSNVPLPDIRINATRMKEFAKLAISLMMASLNKGIMADDKSNLQYRSKQYVKYKANSMRRFTRNTKASTRTKGKQIASDIYFKGKITSNTGKLKGYTTRSINTDVSKVNLNLTGDMLRSLHSVDAQVNHIRVTFSDEQTQKVLGNIKYGYNPVGLSKNDAEQVRKAIIAHLESTKPKGQYSYKVGS